MREIELLLILCFYYFDKGKKIDRFAERFNQYFKQDRSTQTLLFCCTKFANVDPANNNKVEADEYSVLWDIYITGNRVEELKELYRDFKRGAYVVPLERLVDMPDEQKVQFIDPKALVIDDVPKDRPQQYATKGKAAYERSREVASKALALTGYTCEAECSTELFLRREKGIPYTEAHHLIPLCYQDDFDVSLDVEANVVSLCPNCHRKVHFGDGTDLLKKLYDARCERLRKCGLFISKEELLLLYR